MRDDVQRHRCLHPSDDRVQLHRCPERVAFALDDEDGYPNRRQMCVAQLVGLSRGVQWIAERDDAVQPFQALCGKVRGDASAH